MGHIRFIQCRNFLRRKLNIERGGRITGYLADQNGGDYTYAFYGVTIAAGLAFISTIGIYILTRKRPSN